MKNYLILTALLFLVVGAVGFIPSTAPAENASLAKIVFYVR
jgi:hypothetical protein